MDRIIAVVASATGGIPRKASSEENEAYRRTHEHWRELLLVGKGSDGQDYYVAKNPCSSLYNGHCTTLHRARYDEPVPEWQTETKLNDLVPGGCLGRLNPKMEPLIEMAERLGVLSEVEHYIENGDDFSCAAYLRGVADEALDAPYAEDMMFDSDSGRSP